MNPCQCSDSDSSDSQYFQEPSFVTIDGEEVDPDKNEQDYFLSMMTNKLKPGNA